MIVTTSLIYALLSGSWSIVHISFFWISRPELVSESDNSTAFLFLYVTAAMLNRLIFVYNFFVYLITGRQFRSELRSLCRRCCCCCCRHGNGSPVTATRVAETRVQVRAGRVITSNV